MFTKHHENLTVCLNDIDTERILVSQIRYFLNFDCSDKCFPKTYKYDLCKYICLESCDQSECKFDYKDICYYRCPNTTYEPDDRLYFLKIKLKAKVIILTQPEKYSSNATINVKNALEKVIIQTHNVLNAMIIIFFK